MLNTLTHYFFKISFNSLFHQEILLLSVVHHKFTNFADNPIVSIHRLEESLKIEAVYFSKTLVHFYQNTWTHIPKTGVFG
jgi:hypothetical protein